MNARNMRHVIRGLALIAAFASPLVLGGCTQRLIIEEQVPETVETSDQVSGTASGHTESALANQALYVRSGEADPGEQQTGPHPEPWQQRLGPHPEPWQREGDEGDDGKSLPPPSNPDPDPDPKP